MITIPIHKYVPDDYTRKLLLEVYDSGNLVQGKMVERFEKEFAEFSGAKYAAAVSNGTVAITLMLKQKWIPSTHHFVITNPLSFVATRNAIIHANAIPIFVDVDYETGFLNQEQINKACKIYKDQTVSICVVDLHGVRDPVTSSRKNVLIYRDASQSHGEQLQLTDEAMSFSFHMSKDACSGEGGMVLSDNKKLIDDIKLLRNHGMDSDRKIVMDFAYNARMTDLQAAVGIGSIKNLKDVKKKRQKNREFYDEQFSSVEGLKINEQPSQNHHYVLRHKNAQHIVEVLKHFEIDCRKYYDELITYDGMIPVFALPNAKKICEESFCIPVNENLTEDEKVYIVKKVKEVLDA